jgi:prevent-host-death family protein
VAQEITQRELRNESGEIMRRLDRGDSFVVTRRGTPVGELIPLRRHRFVPAEAAVAMFAGAPPVDLDRLRHDLARLADQDIEPRA